MKQTKKTYEAPSIEVLVLPVEDIVTLSNGGDSGSGSNGSGSFEADFGWGI